MGFFSKLFGGAADPYEALGRDLMASMRRVGVNRAYDYDAKQRSLKERGKPDGQLVNLENLMLELRQVPAEARGAAIDRFARAMIPTEMPDSWAKVADIVLPRVMDRAYLAFAQLNARLRGMEVGQTFDSIPLTDDLALGLVIDLPDSIMSLSLDKCGSWQIPPERALEIAVDNLAKRSREAFVAEGPVFTTPWKDNHDASRMSLIETIAALPVKGRPVALAPHRDHLFITGSDDVQGLNLLCDRAAALAEGPRYMGFFPAELANGKWRSLSLPRGHPCWARFTELGLQSKARLYAQQKEMLEQVLPLNNEDVFVATFKAMKLQDGQFKTLSIWTRTVPTLLPRTDEIVFVNVDAPDQKPFFVGWEAAEKVLGPLAPRKDLYPVLHDATRAISHEQWSQLRAAATPAA